ncbi:MAG: hypothetical protein ABIT83_07050 [Massilia sp.]
MPRSDATIRVMKKILPMLLLLSCATGQAADDGAGSLSTANFKQCPQSLWPNEKEGAISPGVASLRVYVAADGKVQQSDLSAPGSNAALERGALRAVLGCVADTALLSRGAGWYNLRYVWGVRPSVLGLEREAGREFMDDALNGDVGSQLALSVQYRSSQRFIADAPEALAWLVRSAESGSADAQLALAIAYASGKGVAEDQAKATLWYGRAARAGKPLAQYQYALQLEMGWGRKSICRRPCRGTGRRRRVAVKRRKSAW